MKVKLILSFFVVVVSILFINAVFTFVVNNPIQRMWISAAVGITVGMGLGYLISRSMVSGLQELSAVAREISAGDLTKEVEVADDEEIGDLARAFRTMVRELNTVVSQVQDNATTLSSSAKGLSNSAQQMSASAQEIASATEHIAKGAEVQAEGVTKASSRIK